MIIKRFFDIIVSFVGILILFVPFIFVCLIIKITSPGPVFFKQVRIGFKKKPFTCLKFRTMFINSEQFGSITTSADSRITHIGRVLRKYKLDELPQLLNVFIGAMSFVGPRPDVEGYADRLEGNNRRILELRPGITGPASIYFRDEEELLSNTENPKEYNDKVIWPKKVRINLYYLDNWSFWKDIGFIFITIFPFVDKYLGLMKQYDKILQSKK